MIEKREINKIAYQKINEENWSHQDTYGFIVANSEVDKKTIAQKLANIPSLDKRNKTRLLRYLFLGLTIAVNIMFFIYTFYGLQLNLMLVKYLVLGLIVFVVLISFYISFRLKTKYKVVRNEVLVDGELNYEEDYFFGNEKSENTDVLDTEMM